MRTAFLLLGAALLMGAFAIPPTLLRQAAATPDGRSVVTRVMLPVDQKLMDIAWRCEQASCAPWFLTRSMGTSEQAVSYTFEAGKRTILVSETCEDDGNWPWDTLDTVELRPGQRLIRVSWRCDGERCVPWYLMRPRVSGEPRTYTFTDGSSVLLIHERGIE